MKDFYCPYCDHGMDREDINSQVHEDDHIGEWNIKCNKCKKPFGLEAEASIDYYVSVKTQEPTND